MVWTAGVFIRSALCCFTEEKQQTDTADYPSKLGSDIMLSALLSVDTLTYEEPLTCIPCTAVKQSCGDGALNMTLEKDDIDGTTPGQEMVYFGHSCCDIIFHSRNHFTAASHVKPFHGTIY